LWEGQHAPRRALGLFPRALGAPQRDWPKQARVTGFPFHVDFGEELDPVLERFLAVGPPPVVFTLGTTAVNDPGRFYDESGEAVQELGCRAVLIVGDAPFRATREGDRIHVIPYAPHRLLFPRAAAIVHQGGIGTLAEAMRAGKPMLIAPYAHDQADNAWRAGRIGISRTVPRRRYRAGVVARELRRLLEHESIRDAALVTALQVALERGAAEAADLIVAALRPERGEQTAPRDRRPYT
jgi:UDP:flavonoid glycosyltransferase YjiC (YdhE family)